MFKISKKILHQQQNKYGKSISNLIKENLISRVGFKYVLTKYGREALEAFVI